MALVRSIHTRALKITNSTIGSLVLANPLLILSKTLASSSVSVLVGALALALLLTPVVCDFSTSASLPFFRSRE